MRGGAGPGRSPAPDEEGEGSQEEGRGEVSRTSATSSELAYSTKPLPSSLAEEKRASEQVCEEQRKWQKQMSEECQQLREHRLKLLGRSCSH